MLHKGNSNGSGTASLRLPELAVPLASDTGWNRRGAKIGAPDELFSMVGGFYAFAKTKADRAKTKDPRLSIEERYKDKADYMAMDEAAARDLALSGFMLEGDIPRLMENASKRWAALAK